MKITYFVTFFLLQATLFISVNAQTLLSSDLVTLQSEATNKLSALIRNYQVLSLNPKSIADICTKGNCSFRLETPGRIYNITLEENKLLSSDYRMAVNGKHNTQQGPTVKTYKGFIGDSPDNYVRLTVGNDFLDGYLKIDSTLLFIKPIKHVLPNYPESNHFLLFNSTDIINNPSVLDCGVLGETKKLGKQINAQNNNTTQSATASCYIVEIATEADYEFYQLRGSSVTVANNSILSELNQVEGLYQSTFNMQFIVTFQNVWTTASDPYSSTIYSAIVLDELVNYWQSNFSSVPRDYVHLFTGKSEFDVRGTAAAITVGRICEVSGGTYALTAANVDNINIANTTAHEIGHLFNAGHIGNTCTTLMCTLTPSDGPDYRSFVFAQASINTINNWLSSNNGCLTDLASVYITGTTPVCSTGSYAVQGLPSGSTVTTWSSNSSGLTMSSSTATRQNNYDGEAIITAFGTLGGTSGCTYTVDKTVWVGRPQAVTGILSGPTTVSIGSLNIYSVPDPNHYSGTFDWRTPRGHTQSGGGDGYNYVQTWIQSNAWDGYVQIWRKNACGNGGARYKWVTVDTGGGCGVCPLTQMSPNPASDQIDINFVSRETGEMISQQDFVEPREYVITDFMGTVVFSYQSKQTKLKLDISQIKRNGVYVLNIQHGGLGTDQYRLIIER
jgi:Reprolysin (M12B) family zinc metalloprotease/Secretion system C-terminal sorting domain